MARVAFAVGLLLSQSFLLVEIDAQNGDCTTPNGITGTCLPIRECEPLLLLLTSRPLSQSSKDFLRRSQCGASSKKDPSVCCPFGNSESKINSDSTGDGFEMDQLDFEHNSLLPKECGRDLSQRIVGGEITELDEFPWIALLEYRHKNGIRTSCGGILISRRYVITAAHCIKRRAASNWILENVRLGEYDTSSERDCVSDGSTHEDSAKSVICADASLSIKIEERIVHEQYDPLSNDRLFDVALLRLEHQVNFTNYIQPICLPSNYELSPKLQVAGWGSIDSGGKRASKVKRKATVSVADHEACAQKYRTMAVNLSPSQICAGGHNGKDSCKGDSGGPLMSLDKTPGGIGRWTAVGIVSFGHPVCGLEGWPGVYTKVIDFVPWLLRKMRP